VIPPVNHKRIDCLIIIVGIVMFVSQYLLFEYYEKSVVWDAFYYIKEYLMFCLLLWYAFRTVEKLISKVIALFTFIFAIFRCGYEMGIFLGYVDLNSDYSQRVFYFLFTVCVWVVSTIYVIQKRSK